MPWFFRRQLRSKSARVRRQALHNMRGQPADAAVPLIDKLLSAENEPAVLLEAIEILGSCEGASARSLLIRQLRRADPVVKVAAIDAIGRSKVPGASPELVTLLTHPDPNVRSRAGHVLQELGWQPNTREEEAALLVSLGDIHRAALLGSAAVGPLTSVLTDTAFQRRVQAANRLADIGDPSAVNPLMRALVDKDDVVRMAVADALGRLGDTRAKAALLPMLKDRHAGVRAAAAGALGGFGEADLLDALISVLQDPHWEVRATALESLGRLHDERATEVVARCLKDPDREVREKAAECLGILGGQQAIGPLVAALVDADRFVRQWARLALNRVHSHWEQSPQAIEQLDLLRAATKSHDFGQQLAARDALKALGDSPSGSRNARPSETEGGRASQEMIVGFLADPDASVRQAAVEALTRISGASAGNIVLALRKDPDASVAAAAEAAAKPALPKQRKPPSFT